MPRYFFDLMTDGAVSVDPEGIDFPDDVDVCHEALSCLSDLLRDDIKTVRPIKKLMVVRNDRSERIFEGEVTMSGRFIPGESATAADGLNPAAPTDEDLVRVVLGKISIH